MRNQGHKERQVVSSIGETQGKRAHCYCAECERSIFPLDWALAYRNGCHGAYISGSWFRDRQAGYLTIKREKC